MASVWCGARRGRGDGDAPRPAPRAAPARGSPAARRTGARARPGRAHGTIVRARACGPRRGRGAGDPPESDAAMHAPCARGAARGAAQRRRGVGRWGEKAPGRAAANSGRRRAEFWCRRQDAMWPGVLRHQIQFWDPSPFGVEGGLGGRTAAEGWARARPEWGIHRAPRRGELVHETRSSRATPATAWMSTDCLRARGSRRAERRSLKT